MAGTRYRRLVQERFPVGRHSSCGTGNGLIFWMGVWGKQLRASDHRLLVIIVEPVFARLKAGNDGMPRRRRMLGCMLARGTVTASDVSTLRAPAKMKPPALRGRQTFHTSVATRLGSGIDSAQALFHSGLFPFRSFPFRSFPFRSFPLSLFAIFLSDLSL